MRSIILALGLLLPSRARAAEASVQVVDGKGRPVEGAVVYVVGKPSKPGPAPKAPSIMDQVDLEFVHHIVPVLAGAKVSFPNKDDVHHHLYSFSEANRFELPLYKGKPAEPVVFKSTGVVRVGCNIHDWMNGVILVLPDPRFAVTDSSGTARLKGLPDGREVELEVYHDRMRGSPEELRQSVKLAKGKAGSVRFEVALKRPPESKRKKDVQY